MKTLKIKAPVLGSLAALALSVAPLAHASLLLFTFSGTGLDFTYTQQSNPVPLSYNTGANTTVPISNFVITTGAGIFNPNGSMQYWSNSQGGGMDSWYGAQLYAGFDTESNPVFAPGGPFYLSQSELPNGYLTITAAVPEPQILGDFGMGLVALSLLVGWETRRRRRPSDMDAG